MLKNKFLDKKKYITRFFYHLFMMDEIRAYRQHVVCFLKKISDPTTHFYPFKEKKYQAQTNRCRTLDVVSNLCKIE
jgi:hypothetical protein